MDLFEHPFIQSLSEPQRDVLFPNIQIMELNPNDILFHEGDVSDSLFLILEGRIDYLKNNSAGAPYLVNFGIEGQLFGEIGLFSEAIRRLTAKAAHKAKVVKIPYENFKNVLQDVSPVMHHIINTALKHLADTTDKYVGDIVRHEKLAMLGSMLANLLHDFKNPLSVISLGSQMILKNHDDDPTCKKMCEAIQQQINRMVSMVQEITDFVQGQSTLRMESINIKKLIEQFKNLNNLIFEDDHLQVVIEIDEGSILGDQNKLIRALQNLVSNAIEACKHKEKPVVEILGSNKGSVYQLTIRDNGKGIPDAIKDTVFEPFVTSGKAKGTGLGTTIVKSIIEGHKGKISFKTAKDVGTDFIVELPIPQTSSATQKSLNAQPAISQ